MEDEMKKTIVLGCCFLLLSACQATRKNTADQQKLALQTNLSQHQVENLIVPDDIEAELYSDLSQQLVDLPSQEKRFDISARDVDARVFFTSLINDSAYSVAVHPDVTGNISLSLKQVTLTEALDIIGDMYGYEITLQKRIYHIYPAGLRVASFTLDYLFMNRMTGSRTSVLSTNISSDDSSDSSSTSSSSTSDEFSGNFSSNGMDEGTDIVTVTNNNYWAYLETKIKTLLKNKSGQEVIVSPMSGVVTIRAYPNYIREVKAFLEKETENLNRQVTLEMQIIEVALTDEYQQGIDWDSAFSSVSQLADSTIQSTIGGGGALTISNGSFNSVITLLATKGDVNVLSKPRITAMNNQKAVIKVGGDEYFVTDFSVTSETTDGTTTTTPDIELTPFFSGISVDVTPKINDDNTVLLHIHPVIVDVDEESKTISYGSDDSLNEFTLPLAKSEVRESDTMVKSNSGDVIVIGGLMKTDQEDFVSETPLLSDLPYIGELFTNRQKINNKSELVILVKPQVVTKSTWKMEIEKSSDLIDNWYPTE
jgi:MSHA biogenesis protein MshL